MLKHCNGCDSDLPIEAFYFNKKLNCRRSRCVECTRKKNKAWRDNNQEHHRKARREHAAKTYAANPVQSRRLAAAKTRKYLRRLRARVLELLGNSCKCGVTDRRVLQIDHVNNGGSTHLRSTGMSRSQFYRHVLAAAAGIYQLLCANCNWRKRLALQPLPKTKAATTAAANDQKRRTLAITRLGGKCVRCPENDPAVLQFDHIAGNGRQDRQKTGRSTRAIAKDALRYGSDKYQLLCANCNQVKRDEEREYPHKYEVVND